MGRFNKAGVVRWLFAFITGFANHGNAHVDGVWGSPSVGWSTAHIEDALPLDIFGAQPRVVSIAQQSCLVGSGFRFKVRDEFAFDLNETVWLEMQVATSVDSNLNVFYDGLEESKSSAKVRLSAPRDGKRGWDSLSIPLRGARFANLGFLRSDFSVHNVANDGLTSSEFTLCNLSLRRTYTTPAPQFFGWVAIKVLDEKGRQVPARLGLYDSSGRLPLPSDQAVLVRHLNGPTRVVPLGVGSIWPVKSRLVFYTDGCYRARLPVGNYECLSGGLCIPRNLAYARGR